MRWGYLLSALLAVAGCTAVHYESPGFSEQTRDHESIAVLPFEMVFTGQVPKNLTAVQVERIEEIESAAFQHSLYNRLLNRSSARRKKPIRIEIQPVDTTLRLLEAEGVGLRECWRMPATEVAELLGVDAVVRSRVRKTRYLSDLESYAVDLGVHVLIEATEGAAVPWIHAGLGRTYDIHAESEIVGADDGRVLWKIALDRSTDWRRPANDVVEGVTKKLAREFPYRG